MTQQINVVFDPPSNADTPAQFKVKAQDMGLKFNPYTIQINAVAAEVNNNALAAASAKTGAETARDQATAQAQAAANAVAGAATTWVANASYTLNQLVWLGSSSGAMYRCTQAHSGRATSPASDSSYWVQVTPDSIPLANVTGAGTAAAATLTTSAQDYTVGRVLRVGDMGLGGVGIVFSGVNANTLTETVFGRRDDTGSNWPTASEWGTVTVVRGTDAIRQMISDIWGSRLWVRVGAFAPTVWQPWREMASVDQIAGSSGVALLTTVGSSTWTASKTGLHEITIIGGGGAGGSGENATQGAGGAGGGRGERVMVLQSLTAGNSYSYTVGGGGAGSSFNGMSAVQGVTGPAGGNSADRHEIATGGGQGTAGNQSSGSLVYGNPGAMRDVAGGAGGIKSGSSNTAAQGGKGYGAGGGGGRGRGNSDRAGSGGGGAGGYFNPSISAAAGTTPGGTSTPGTGGAGAQGCILIRW